MDVTPLQPSLGAVASETAGALLLADERAAPLPRSARDALGAVELAKTDCLPCWTTPAVAPLTRALMSARPAELRGVVPVTTPPPYWLGLCGAVEPRSPPPPPLPTAATSRALLVVADPVSAGAEAAGACAGAEASEGAGGLTVEGAGCAVDEGGAEGVSGTP